MTQQRTLEEIAAIEGNILEASDIAPFFGVNPQSIRDQAHKDRESFGFRVTIIGNKVFFPKKPFIKYWGGIDNASNAKKDAP